MLLCGDVETNPGPNNQALLLQILEGQEALRGEVADLKVKTKSFRGPEEPFSVAGYSH